MIDKVHFLNKLKISVLNKNILLGSLNYLPSDLKKDLEKTFEQALIFYRQNFLKSSLKAFNAKELFLPKTSKMPEFLKGELLLIIIPHNEVKYVFQTLVEEITPEGYKLRILNPRHEKKLTFKTVIPVFLSFIPHDLFLNFLQKDYYLIRESNFSLNSNNLHFYDFIFDEKNKIDEKFKKAIHEYQIKGELVNISSEGAYIKTSSIIQIPKKVLLIYTKFEISIKNKSLSFGLLCHLRNFHFEEDNTFFLLHFLISFKPEVWNKIEELIKPLIK